MARQYNDKQLEGARRVHERLAELHAAHGNDKIAKQARRHADACKKEQANRMERETC